MLSENVRLLGKYAQQTLADLKLYEETREESFSEIIESRSGQKTVQVFVNGNMQLIHSKYDPQKEAEKFISQFQEVSNEYEHVLFYGVGFGYHIKEFMTQFPSYTFSIYEPEVEIFYQFMNHCQLNDLPLERLKDIVIETSREKGKLFLEAIMHNIRERILVVTLPSYERIFKDKFEAFAEDFKAAMEAKRLSHYVNMNFSSRWTLNSLINLPYTIQTPNIFEGYEAYFKDKPLIIVAAGPSLEEEYENLRYIKEHQLAYIFAVGSANRALIAQDILPDAVCTYDPQGHNHNVFWSMIEQGITSVPMIYGSSVGFETLEWYKGPKIHMVTTQDTVSQNYIKNKNHAPIELVEDSPTIAAITFQVAAKLGCNPIIFAGQNLAFKNKQFYSKDVDYKERNRSVRMEEEDEARLILVDDVYGNKVESNPSFNSMREYIEWQIKNFPMVEVLNTTKGGAAILGTTFKPLEEIIAERLVHPVVVNDWHTKAENQYDLSYTKIQIQKMEQSLLEFRKLYKDIFSILGQIEKNIKYKKEAQAEKNILKFDKLMKKIIKNNFYTCYIAPVNREQFQALSIRSAKIRKQTDELEKGQLIIEAFSPYLQRCKATAEKIAGSIYKVHQTINKIGVAEEYKFYESDCGVFHYEGNWEKQSYNAGETIDYKVLQHVTKSKDSTIRFCFTGRSIRIYGSKRSDGSDKIQINIDGNIEKISTKTFKVDIHDVPNVNDIIFEKKNLNDGEHEVEIKLLDEDALLFAGIEIAQSGRIYHIHEVKEIEQLGVGKRIRCHYKATYNTVGEFSGLGEETGSFIPPESSAYPDGDFYFIMVDESDEEGRKLIADRVVQNYISWKQLKSNLPTMFYRNQRLMISLPTGNSKLHQITDSEKVIQIDEIHFNQNKNNIMWNYDCISSSWIDEAFWCNIEGKVTYVGFRGSNHGTKDNSFENIYIRREDIVDKHVGFRPKLVIGSN